MIVLGISPLDKDATVTLMIDGKVAYAIAEERLSRQKMHAGFPRSALAMVLERSGVEPADIDHVVYAFLDCQTEARLMRRNWKSDYWLNRSPDAPRTTRQIDEARRRLRPRSLTVHGLADPMESLPKPWYKRAAYRLATADGLLGDWANRWQFRKRLKAGIAEHRRFEAELLAGLEEFGLRQPLERVEHHQTHVANAFFHSGFDRALVVTVDAYGSGLSATVSSAEGTKIDRLSTVETPCSLGNMYSAVTSALGFNPDRHAGKVVGLAAFGDPDVLRKVLLDQFVWSNGSFAARRSSDVFLSRRLAAEFPKIDVAAAYQAVLEEVVRRYVLHYVEQTGHDTLVLSGGVTANVKMNQRLFELPGIRRVYIHPNMGDGGCGTGAALMKCVEAGIVPERLDDVYLGPEYSDRQMETAIREAGLSYRHVPDIECEIARLIAADQVVARFQGRMEYGPRALGNRSVLYQATDPAVNQWLNARLGRTEFMPFAPATLFEDRHQCYEHVDGAEFAAQFMTITFDCTPWMIEHCPAAVHVDGTARPQLVTEQANPSFYAILRNYKALTGLPCIINTSFNMHEEPIVCSPQDAVRAFVKGQLDYLAMGNFLIGAESPRQAKRTSQRGETAAASTQT